MLAIALILALALALALAPTSGAAAQAQAGFAPAPRQGPLVVDRVTVIDVEHGARLRDQRVVVVGNRIQAIGSRRTVSVPPGARVVNAQGQYLIPGMWDMHVHLAQPRATVPGVDERTRHQVNAIYRQLLANGVTGMRDAGSSVPLDTFRVWKREIAAGQRAGPRLIVSGPSINRVGGDFALEDSQLRGGVIRCWQAAVPANVSKESCSFFAHQVYTFSPADAQHLVDSLHAAGADMIKTYTLTPAMYFAIAAEARRVGIPFGGHVLNEASDAPSVTGLIASDSGARILDHGLWTNDVCGSRFDTLLSLTRCTAVAARLRHNHTWVATGGIGGPAFSDAADTLLRHAMRYMGPIGGPQPWAPLSAAQRRQLPSGADFRAALPDSALHGQGCQEALLAYAADLPVMPGPDAPYWLGRLGSGVHLFMLAPVLCGVPPLWALRAATLNPALALQATDSLGTVAVGKVADLVLLDGDPLVDIWNVSKIAGVLANGRYYDRAALDRLLTEATTEWNAAQELQRQEEEQAEAARRAGEGHP